MAMGFRHGKSVATVIMNISGTAKAACKIDCPNSYKLFEHKCSYMATCICLCIISKPVWMQRNTESVLIRL